MAISEDEAQTLMDAILDAIAKQSTQPGSSTADEMIGQWRAEVEAGRPIDRKLKVRGSPGLDELAGVPRSRTTSTGEFVGKQAYLKVEQLDMLLEALGLAFIVPHMMAFRLVETIERYREPDDDAPPPWVALAKTGEVGDPSLFFDRRVAEQAAAATAPLARLIDELSRKTGLRERLLALVADPI
ncbi:hypothetical protein [Antarcticirhabdus aurantiaca]|uniref:Uncharacterized protein n=1 Tax=Antarcticirhabdus aurantiaca TaxID=2606717 RepID=A0ACD4NNN9_9HYPH|nr:hypothetical protein [Antarcticirhabdus aurantiaca]WAJ28512.1 hypothetical protein OXU80_27525 [Jeongeuplla avenae]